MKNHSAEAALTLRWLLKEENQALLDDSDFDTLYSRCAKDYSPYRELSPFVVRGLTSLLTEILDCRTEDLLLHLSKVPPCFSYVISLPSVLRLPDNITSIEDAGLSNTLGLKKIVIPGSVKIIGEGAFLTCEYLETVVIEEGVEVIKKNAFMNCKRLKSVTIPESVTTISKAIFEDSDTLEEIKCKAKAQPSGWSKYWLENGLKEGFDSRVTWGA